MSTIVTRAGKGSPLTNTELDSNFQNLNTDKAELSGATFTGNLSLGDNVKLQLGNQTNGDLQLYHDGSHSYIDEVGTGALIVRANYGLFVKKYSDNTQLLNARTDGAVELFHNGTERLATTSTGISISNDANFPDNGKAIFGAGDDLQIYHDGSASRIVDAGTGSLKIQAENFAVNNVGDTENMITAEPDGAVALFHNGSPKIATTSTGIDVTGSVVADGLTVEGATTPVIRLESETSFLNVNTAGKIEFYTNDASTNATGVGAEIVADSVSTLASVDLIFKTRNSAVSASTVERFKVANNGDISFYNSAGSSQNFYWDSSTSRLGLGVTNPSRLLHLQSNGPDAYLRLNSTGNESNAFMEFGTDDTTWTVGAKSNESFVFNNGTERLTINADGSSVFSGAVSTGGDVNLRFDSTGDGVNGYDINWLNSATQGTDDRLALIRVTNEGGDGSNRGGKLSFLTRQSGNANFNSALVLNKSGNATFSGSVSTAGNIVNDIGNSGDDSFIELKNTGYTGNITSLRQNADSIRAELNSTERSIFIQAGSGGGVSGAEVRLYTNTQLGLKVDASQNVNIPNGGLMIGATTAPSATLEVGALSSGSTGNVIINHEGGVTPVLQVKARTNRAILAVQDNDTSGYISSENGIFSIGRNSGSHANNINIDANNNVGIGTSSPSSTLHIKTSVDNSVSQGLIIERSANSDRGYINYQGGAFRMVATDGDPIRFGHVSSSNEVSIHTDGSLLVGTTSTSLYNDTSGGGINLFANGGVTLAKQATSVSDPVLLLNNTGTAGQMIDLRQDGTTVGSIGTSNGDITIDASGGAGVLKASGTGQLAWANNLFYPITDNAKNLGTSSFRFKDLYLSNNATAQKLTLTKDPVGTYSIEVDGTNTGQPNLIVKQSTSERFRCDNNGNLLVGVTSTSSQISVKASSVKHVADWQNFNDGGYGFNFKKSDGSIVGTIAWGSSSTSYNTSSDQRLKENIEDADDAGSKIDAIQVRQYDWKADGSHQDYGMVAQELLEVAPEAVSGDADSEEMMGVDYSKLVPMLIKEIQSLRQRVAQLEE